MGSFFIALALSLPPLFLGAYGYDETADFCWYTRSYDVVFAGLFISPFKWATNYLPSIIFIAYSTFASVRVMLRLRRAQLDSINVNQDSKNSSQRQNAKTQKIVAKLVSRLMFYPLVPLISNFFNIYGEADYAISHTNKFSLLVPALTGTSIQGLLTSILFFTIDPAWTKLYIDIRKYYDPHFEEAKSSSASNTGSGFESMGKAVSSVGQNQYHNTYHHFEGPKVISEIRTPATKEGVARFV
ncbi:hypothetical protein HK099_006105 [Clydaea vesicula]|uniref:Uncharacterized protein n=1 Tax=Clydaea vesicula TaxID=447962 RepID=A0AAD5TYA8_9FUNG|nr:hypothetical protein HK099_006105 [Clydaea vesicula]